MLLNIGTLNAQTLLGEDRWVELETALEEKTWDIIGLSEIRRGHEVAAERKSGNLVFHSSGEKGLFGTGFIVNRKLKSAVKEFRPINTRLAALKLEIKKVKVWIIQAHLPTSSRDEDQVKETYEVIEKHLTEMRKETRFVMVIGDFNASIGNRKTGEEQFIGVNTFGKRNDRGEMLVDFMMKNHLIEASTWFQTPLENRWTWAAPNGRKHKIDYVFISNKRDVHSCKIGDFKFNSDHRLVLCKMYLKPERRFWIFGKNGHSTNTTALRLGSNILYAKALKEAIKSRNFSEGTAGESLQNKYDRFQSLIEEATKASNVSGLRKENQKKKKRITDKTRQLIVKREELNKKINKTPADKIEHAELRKLVRKEIRKDIQVFEEAIVNEIVKSSGATKKAMKEISPIKKRWTQRLEVNGRKITNREEIVEAFTQFFEELYCSNETKNGEENSDFESELMEEEVEKNMIITLEEVKKVLQDIKPGKSPGPDQISNDMLRTGKEQIAPILSEIFTDVLNSGEIPSQWKVSSIILLFKKGSRENMGNYRPITLSSCVYRIFARILRDRISPIINEKQPEEQAGFRSSYSTMDHLQTINQLTEKSMEYGFSLYLAFVDFTKAFDSIKHHALWSALKECEIESKYIRVIKNLYEENEAFISMDCQGRRFQIKRGVKQGCPLSPVLFNCVLEAALKKCNWSKDGIFVMNRSLSNLRFADDVVLISKSASKMEKMLQELAEVCEEDGLVINRSKTKLLTNAQKVPICLREERLEYDEETIYLGQTISFENRNGKEVERRIKIGWRKFWSLRSILKAEKVSRRAKSKVIKSCILPTITYGCQTWSLSKVQYERLRVTHMQMLRSVMKIRREDKIRNEEVLRRMNVEETLDMIVKRSKLKWAGHVARMNKERWAWKATFWSPVMEKRGRGRKPIRWIDEITRKAGNNWKKKAENREEWLKICTSPEID